ncbi:MAG: DUF2804 domain-containing protein [Treponema sp.]|nr:DUF2804 domain-containing protein [Treponema sp.]
MYTREILAPRATPIENGIPLTGTWDKAFAQVNLLDIQKPYRCLLPRGIRDGRIKEWEGFSVQDERFCLEAFLGNFKIFQAIKIFLYNKENEETHVFERMSFRKNWRLPQKLENASVECRAPGFFFRIHTWLTANTVKLDIDIEATKKQPAFTTHLSFAMGNRDISPLVVSLNFAERRNMYAFKALSSVRGDIVLDGRHASLDPARCTGIFRDYKGFFPYRMRFASCGSMGFDEEGRRYGFHIVENQARETRRNNENALWLDGRLTPLPPVRITMPGGPESDWVIQDVEGMVDLVFTPKTTNRFRTNLLLAKGDFFAPMGYYNGMLVTAKEEQIQVHNQWGIGEKLYLRV